MDVKVIVGVLFQVGLGAWLVYAARIRLNKIEKTGNQKLWKIAAKIGLVWGWIIVLFSSIYLMIYLMIFVLSLS